MIQYLTGDATRPVDSGPKVIVHICNDKGAWERGFVLALSKRWKAPEAAYRRWVKREIEEPFGLGEVQFVPVESELWVANLIGQHGIGKRAQKPPIRYDAVRRGLEKVARFAVAHSASVHMPRIGCGLAGGRWELIEPIIQKTMVAANVDVTVYDFGL